VAGDPLAAGPDGRVARYEDGWTDVGTVESVRAIDGRLLVAADGVYRVGDRLDPVGIENVHDVAATGPFAATAAGLYRLGNGWLAECDCDAHAASADSLYARDDGRWEPVALPVEERVVDVAHGPATYAVTAAGTVLVNAGDGWRSRALEVAGASALAVAP